jgi:hypothetical protein
MVTVYVLIKVAVTVLASKPPAPPPPASYVAPLPPPATTKYVKLGVNPDGGHAFA